MINHIGMEGSISYPHRNTEQTAGCWSSPKSETASAGGLFHFECRPLARLRHAEPYDECRLSGVMRRQCGHRETVAIVPKPDIALF
jgi:hypothetical protein